MRQATPARLALFGDRARVAAFDVAALDWWDRMFGVDRDRVVAVPAPSQRREEAVSLQGGGRAAVAARRAARSPI